MTTLTSGDENVFHDCDMFAPFSGLPHGGEGEEAEEKSVLKVWRYRRRERARIRDGRCDWLQPQAVTDRSLELNLEFSSHSKKV